MKRALAYRRSYFTRAGVVGGVVAGLSLFGARYFRSDLEPDVFTWVLLAFAVGELIYFSAVSFTPDRVVDTVGRARRQRMSGAAAAPPPPTPFRFRARRLVGQDAPESLDEIGRSLAFMGAAFMLHPILFGAVCMTLSGDAWRVVVFLPVAVAAALVYWVRMGRTLRVLEQRGY